MKQATVVAWQERTDHPARDAALVEREIGVRRRWRAGSPLGRTLLRAGGERW